MSTVALAPGALPEVASSGHENGPIEKFAVLMSAALTALTAMLIGIYMLPWALAATRGNPNTASIGKINRLYGWTIIGYCWALVMAVNPRPEPAFGALAS